jgi:hypothetical protein
MRVIVRSILGFGSVLLLGASQSASAQDFPVMFSSPTGGYAADMLMTRQMMRPIMDQVEGTKSQSKARENNQTSSIPLSVSPTYTPSISVRKKNLANFVAKTRATDPAGADQMEQVFASGDIIEIVDGALKGKGLTVSNAADAYAVWWVSAWQAANGDTSERSNATYKAVSGQAARGFANSPEFAKATDAQKQEMAEAMLVQTVMIDQMNEASAGDPAMKQKLADAVKQGAKASGIDLDTMTLTEQGFAKADGR